MAQETFRDDPLSLPLRIIIAFHVLNLCLWLVGQTGAVLFYDTVAAMGLQDPRDDVDAALVETNRGLGLADTLIPIPLLIMSAVGLYRRKFYGAICSWMVFSWTLYWPMVFFCSQWFYKQNSIKHAPVTAVNAIVPAVFWCFAVWASWHLCRREKAVLYWWQTELEYQRLVSI
jgi:hypothetical protein